MVVVYFLAFTPVSSLVFADRGIKDESAAVSKIPVVMLLFDELSLAAITTADGEIDAGRLSNFSRLERISTWYRNTTTVSTQTEKAVRDLIWHPPRQKYSAKLRRVSSKPFHFAR